MLVSVTLCLRGDDLKPAVVSSRLRTRPNFAKEKHEVTTSSSGKNSVSKFGLWEWVSEDPASASAPLGIEEHIDRLIAQFEASFDFSQINGVTDAWIGIYCSVDKTETDQSTMALVLSPSLLCKLAKFNLPVELSVDVLERY